MLSKVMVISSVVTLPVYALSGVETSMRTSDVPKTTSAMMDIVHEVASSMTLELSFVIFFMLGFVVLRLDKAMKRRKESAAGVPTAFAGKMKTIRADYNSAMLSEVVQTWREVNAAKFEEACPLDVLRMVMHAIMAEETETTASLDEFTKYVVSFQKTFALARGSGRRSGSVQGGLTGVLNQLLHVVATRNVASVSDVYSRFCLVGGMKANEETYEVLSSTFAQLGDVTRLNAILEEMAKTCKVVSPRAYALTVTGLLRSGSLELSLTYMRKMVEAGSWIPNHLMLEMFRAAISAGQTAEVLQAVAEMKPEVALSAETISLLLNQCYSAGRADVQMAEMIMRLVKERKITLAYAAYDSLVKIYATEASIHAIEYFDELVAQGFTVTEASCVSIVSLCAQSKFINLGEHVYRHCRETSSLSLPVCAALMKVYAHAKMFDKACSLYDQVIADGLTPDAAMNGCVIDFAVRAGRTDLSEKLFQSSKFPKEIQSYMSQLRACRRDKDAQRALSLLKEMKVHNLADKAAFNSALDVCIMANAMQLAESLLAEMKETNLRDAVTYNTMLKGLCVSGHVEKAMNLLVEMREDGFPPNAVSYNSILNVLVMHHNYDGAWDLVKKMKADGIDEDHFTLATLMKAVKVCSSAAFAKDVLSLLDTTQVDMLKDDVLLHVVLDVCVRLRDMRRLLIVVERVKQSKVSLSVPTLNTLIKALSNLRRISDAKKLWADMTEVREMQPNDISIGCMVDALVSNDLVGEAVDLVKKWKGRISMNCVIYSTLMKGFTLQRNTDAAFEVLELMSEEGVKPNLVTLNTLLDACARSGRMERCGEVMRDIREKHGLMPDRITYSTLVKGFCHNGDIPKALALVNSMKEQGLKPDAIIFNTVMDGCVGKDKFGLCDEMLESMKQEGVKPTDYTLTVLIKRYGREGKLNKAFDLVNTFPKLYSLRPSVAAMTCLISACIANRDLDRALRVYEKMKTDGPAPDAMTHEKLINAQLRNGKAEKACRLVEEAYGLHGPLGRISSRAGTTCPSGTVTPGGTKARVSDLSSAVLENLVDQLARKGLVDTHAMPLVEKLRAAGVKVPQRLFAMTLKGAVTETISAAPWRGQRRN